MGVLGPNGAGKSTLIKTVMNMIKPNGGYVKIFGQEPKHGIKRIGYIPQREFIDWDFPVTVFDVVLMGRYGHHGWLGKLGKEDRRKASECLEQVNMLPYSDRPIGNLSGGQQQRVFLARALAQESAVYLMDEPFEEKRLHKKKLISIIRIEGIQFLYQWIWKIVDQIHSLGVAGNLEK